jgi:hypothetical protein
MDRHPDCRSNGNDAPQTVIHFGRLSGAVRG